ncbi:MAG: ATP-dependent helicase [Desulfamplus sp.]|nr:ATP-dependent helicase [Desulfamplus sp.]
MKNLVYLIPGRGNKLNEITPVLEFKVVFVIGLSEGVLPNKNGDVEEERRIVFVAMSRAMELLYLSYSQIYMSRKMKSF